MRILVLADLASFHTPRWIEALERHNPGEVYALSLEPPREPRERWIYVPPRVQNLTFRYVLTADRVKRVVEDLQPDLLNPVNMPNYGLLAALVAGRRPVYLVGWGSDILLTAEKTPIHRQAFRFLIHRAQHIAVDALVMRDRLTEGYGYPRDRITVITWGVPEELRNRPIPPFEPPEEWILVSHRRIAPDMDPFTTLRAVDLLVQQNLPVRLIMASDGSLGREARAFVAARPTLRDRVTFTGFLPYEELMATVARGHLYLSASLVDSTSVSLLEAMALGVFPVVSDLPANREWILDGFNGLLFEPGNPRDLARRIQEAMARPERIQRARQLNKALVQEKACWECHIARVYREMQRLVEES